MSNFNRFESLEKLPGEKLILETTNHDFFLTNYRISNNTFEGFGTMLLSKISSIDYRYSSRPITLIVGIICAIVGLAVLFTESSGAVGIVGVIVGVIFILVYFNSRTYTLVITSDGGSKMTIRTTGRQSLPMVDLATEIENACAKFQKSQPFFPGIPSGL